MLRTTKSSEIDETVLINYRASLDIETEYLLGVIKGFLIKWYELGYPGISSNVIELLNGWRIRGNFKGDVVKRLDPIKGPLSDIELQGFNEGIIQAYEKSLISLTDLAIGLITSNTGRRQVQISHLKIKDILQGQNHKGEALYLVNIPRAKQRNTKFRGASKQFAITRDLWVILNAQVTWVKRELKNILNLELNSLDELEVPLFPDWNALSEVKSCNELRLLLDSDWLHIAAAKITESLKRISLTAGVYSERTGEALYISSRRFRYTTGTRSAREGFGSMVIAELLDHSDNQNAHVYIENIPEHVERIDKSVGHQLAFYAQAFAGVLVDSESNAKRGDDIKSRVRKDGKGIGTCGSYGFCGANVPIPCYTCMHFQPWLDGPHEELYEQEIAERNRLFELTGDLQIAAINDRSILAIANVIQLCAKRLKEISHG
jgi:integrase